MNAKTLKDSRGAFSVLLAVLALSYFAATFYTLFLNPEVQFWKTAYEQKSEWAKDLSTKGPKTVFVGGSSCAFQVDSGQLTQTYNIPSVNMGIHAGAGAPTILALGLSVISPGDTLMLYLEPSLLTAPPDYTPLGYQMLAATGLAFEKGRHWEALSQFSLGELLSSIRPGLPHTVTMLAKLLTKRPLYRYGIGDLARGGGMSTNVRMPVQAMNSGPIAWNRESSDWLEELTLNIETNEKIQTFYIVPLGLFQTEAAEEARGAFRDFLAHAPKPISPLADPAMGVATNPADFADSAQHLNRDAMIERTKEVAEVLERKNP